MGNFGKLQQASQPRCQDLQRSLMSLHHKAPILGPGAGPRTPGELRVVADYGRLHKALELKQRHDTTWQKSSKSCKIKQIRIPWTLANWNPGFLHLDLSWSYIRLHMSGMQNQCRQSSELAICFCKLSRQVRCLQHSPKTYPQFMKAY